MKTQGGFFYRHRESFYRAAKFWWFCVIACFAMILVTRGQGHAVFFLLKSIPLSLGTAIFAFASWCAVRRHKSAMASTQPASAPVQDVQEIQNAIQGIHNQIAEQQKQERDWFAIMRRSLLKRIK